MAEYYMKKSDAYRVLTNYYHHTTEFQHATLKEALDIVPVEYVSEREVGKWEDVEVEYIADKVSGLPFESIASMRCPICNRYNHQIYYYGDPKELEHYCGFCGAKIEGSDAEPPKEE